MCGPQVFCCPNAARVLLSRHPGAIPVDVDWEFTDAEHLLSWYDADVLEVMYFFVCDPANRDRIHFVGLHPEDAKGAETPDFAARHGRGGHDYRSHLSSVTAEGSFASIDDVMQFLATAGSIEQEAAEETEMKLLCFLGLLR